MPLHLKVHHAMTDLASPDNKQYIELTNPVRADFLTFIYGNVCQYQEAKQTQPPVVEFGSAKGKEVVICGAGPSLRDHAAEYCTPDRDVWGCNSAVTWLYDNKHHVTHGFTVDQTPQMLSEWVTTPPVEYLLASSVHCHLSELLMSRGREIRYFHNYVGLPGEPVSYSVCKKCNAMDDANVPACKKCGSKETTSATMAFEDWVYALLYPSTVRAGSGLNAVTRAIDVALYAGYDKIYVLGADCALRLKKPRPKNMTFGSKQHHKWLTESTEMHANGGNAIASGATAHTMGGTIDGRHWETKPDLMVTAVFMVKMKQELGDRLQIIGDGLPAALMDKPDEYLDRLPSLLGQDGKPIRYVVNRACIPVQTP